MNISPVSFASTTPSSNLSFEERIKKPQAYTTQETPSAASGIGKEGKSKKSPVKKIAGAVIVLSAAAAGLAYAARTGKLAAGTNETLNKIKAPLETAGNYIYEKAAVAKSWLAEKIPSAAKHVETEV